MCAHPLSLPVLALKSPTIKILIPFLFSFLLFRLSISLLDGDPILSCYWLPIFVFYLSLFHHLSPSTILSKVFSIPSLTLFFTSSFLFLLSPPSVLLYDLIPSTLSINYFLTPITIPPIVFLFFFFLPHICFSHTYPFDNHSFILPHAFSSIYVSVNTITSQLPNHFQKLLFLFLNTVTFQNNTFHPSTLLAFYFFISSLRFPLLSFLSFFFSLFPLCCAS